MQSTTRKPRQARSRPVGRPSRPRHAELGDGTFLNVYENVPPGPGDKEPRSVLDLLIPRGPGAKDAVLLTLGMPASQGARGLKLLALIKSQMKIDW